VAAEHVEVVAVEQQVVRGRHVAEHTHPPAGAQEYGHCIRAAPQTVTQTGREGTGRIQPENGTVGAEQGRRKRTQQDPTEKAPMRLVRLVGILRFLPVALHDGRPHRTVSRLHWTFMEHSKKASPV
jgi:hypothetical protein